ncbi:unnamed protein product [Macrosiphum euphorbiae]|uniref:Uncharacterized protein n=1 Tax=Macrosiphum euphorbiae TaxID=13131 RepID=A0AAV0X1R5_9HEMI|nr:unnamed protein product [Macrosiphum euphorbiae]
MSIEHLNDNRPWCGHEAVQCVRMEVHNFTSGHQLITVSPMVIPRTDNVTSIAGNGMRSGNVVANRARERQTILYT